MKGGKTLILMAVLFCGFFKAQAQLKNDSVFNKAIIEKIHLNNVQAGRSNKRLIPLTNQQLILFVFLSPECPICRNYTPVLNTLEQRYRQSIQMMGIVPGMTYSRAIVQAFAKKYKIKFPLFIDSRKELSNYLQASITPEVILLNNHCELMYKGAIDNRIKQLGVQRWKATENYLEDVVNKYLEHSSIVVKRITPIGCRINDF